MAIFLGMNSRREYEAHGYKIIPEMKDNSESAYEVKISYTVL